MNDMKNKFKERVKVEIMNVERVGGHNMSSIIIAKIAVECYPDRIWKC